MIDVENPSTRQFIANGLLPNWSPAGNRIVYQRNRERGLRWFSIWTIDYEGG